MITQCFFVFSPLWLDEMQRYITAFTSRPPSLHHLGPLWKSFGGLMISWDSKWGPVEFRIVRFNDHSMLHCLLSPLAWRNATLYHSFYIAPTQPTPPWTYDFYENHLAVWSSERLSLILSSNFWILVFSIANLQGLETQQGLTSACHRSLSFSLCLRHYKKGHWALHVYNIACRLMT